jgi:hypothetical protein
MSGAVANPSWKIYVSEKNTFLEFVYPEADDVDGVPSGVDRRRCHSESAARHGRGAVSDNQKGMLRFQEGVLKNNGPARTITSALRIPSKIGDDDARQEATSKQDGMPQQQTDEHLVSDVMSRVSDHPSGNDMKCGVLLRSGANGIFPAKNKSHTATRQNPFGVPTPSPLSDALALPKGPQGPVQGDEGSTGMPWSSFENPSCGADTVVSESESAAFKDPLLEEFAFDHHEPAFKGPLARIPAVGSVVTAAGKGGKGKGSRPCQGQRQRYHKLLSRLHEQIERDPSSFDVDSLELPPSISQDIPRRVALLRSLEHHKAKQILGIQASSTVDHADTI